MKSWLKGMSFSSRAWSNGTLLRGLDLLEQGSSAAMSSMVDPDPRALMEELARLEVPWSNQPTVCSFRFGERLKSYVCQTCSDVSVTNRSFVLKMWACIKNKWENL
jgi:hypothetical protein